MDPNGSFTMRTAPVGVCMDATNGVRDFSDGNALDVNQQAGASDLAGLGSQLPFSAATKFSGRGTDGDVTGLALVPSELWSIFLFVALRPVKTTSSKTSKYSALHIGSRTRS